MILVDFVGTTKLYECCLDDTGSIEVRPMASETFDKSGKVIGDAK